MEFVDVSLDERSYQIKIGSGLLADPLFCSVLTAGTQVVIISNTVVAPLYLSKLEQNLIENGMNVSHFILPDGERIKSLDSIEKIMTYLLKKQYGRDVVLLALGGGVIGDLVGFSAAIFQRGVRFIQVPTTLLAQVDSSVGGKTGVNHPLGKNMLGAFYQPTQVVIDLDTLQTLSTRQFSAGLAEIIKYGVILDPLFFTWLENNIALLMRQDKKALTYCIQRCCELKAAIVMQDEKEQLGIRERLNLGHTFGHAIETFFEYKDWLHGEAVAMGIVMAAQLSYERNTLSYLEKSRIVSLLSQANLPIERPKAMPIEAYLPLMLRDKKNRNGVLRLVLPHGLGCGEGVMLNDEEQILRSIASC